MSDFDPGPGWREVTYEQWRGDTTPAHEDTAYLRVGTEDHYFWREAPVSPLPTKPGYYVAEHPDFGGLAVVVELLNSPAGQWVDAGDRQYLTEADVREMGALARLERRAVTAKAVLDRVMVTGISGPVVGELYREFGAES